MTAVRLVSKLLKFKGFRAVSLWFEGRGGSDIVIAVKPHKTGCRCPECGRRGKIVHTLAPRRWRDVRVCGRTVWLQHRPRNVAPGIMWRPGARTPLLLVMLVLLGAT